MIRLNATVQARVTKAEATTVNGKLYIEHNLYELHIRAQNYQQFLFGGVPAGFHPRGGHVAVYVFDINQPSLPTPFYSVLVSVSVFMALSSVLHSIHSPDNSSLSHPVLPVLFLPYWPF